MTAVQRALELKRALADGDMRTAKAHALALLEAAPDDKDVCAMAGVVLVAVGEHRQARELLQRAEPTPELLQLLALCSVHLLDVPAAEAYVAQLIRLQPASGPALKRWLTVATKMATEKAQGLVVNPIHSDTKASAALRAGRLREGYAALLSQVRRELSEVPGAPYMTAKDGRRVPMWKGQRVPHLAVIDDHGHGDALQFVRFTLAAAQRVDKVTAVTAPELVGLFRANGIEAVGRWVAEDVLVHASAQTEPMLLPGVIFGGYGTTAGYLKAPARHDFGPGFHVGVAWLSSEGSDRSVSVEALQPLASVPGVTYYCLQHGARAAQRPAWMQPLDVGDYLQTAGLMAGLDLVISVDSSPVHLAGALGRPTWLALPAKHTDWRWETHPTASAWYSTVRLFRGPKCFESMAAELAPLAGTMRPEPWAPRHGEHDGERRI